MALKEYLYRGSTWQFEEADAPEGAEPLDRRAARPARKSRAAKNKSREAANDKAVPGEGAGR